ncbi:hypothetical protein ABBQ38_002320 [Trebouxia sp. C0009 RCD-2024]
MRQQDLGLSSKASDTMLRKANEASQQAPKRSSRLALRFAQGSSRHLLRQLNLQHSLCIGSTSRNRTDQHVMLLGMLEAWLLGCSGS